MKIKDKITQSLASITVELQEISPDFYVIGASAMILSGIEVGETADIDILTTEMNSCKLQHLLKTYMEISPETKEDDLFRSNFARFKLPLMDIEVMGDLQIKKNDIWQSVCVKEYEEIFIGNLIINRSFPKIDYFITESDSMIVPLILADNTNESFLR